MKNLKPFMFVLDVAPMKEHAFYEDVAGAKAHIWVLANDFASAKLRALNYNKKHLWELISVEHEFEILEEQILNFHEDEVLQYQKALQFGIAADYIAHQKQN